MMRLAQRKQSSDCSRSNYVGARELRPLLTRRSDSSQLRSAANETHASSYTREAGNWAWRVVRADRRALKLAAAACRLGSFVGAN